MARWCSGSGAQPKCEQVVVVRRDRGKRRAADETAQEVTGSAEAAPANSRKAGQDARRIEAWSLAWMLLALVIWGWFLFLMLADYGPEMPSYAGGRAVCRGPFVEPSPQNRVCRPMSYASGPYCWASLHWGL